MYNLLEEEAAEKLLNSPNEEITNRRDTLIVFKTQDVVDADNLERIAQESHVVIEGINTRNNCCQSNWKIILYLLFCVIAIGAYISLFLTICIVVKGK